MILRLLAKIGFKALLPVAAVVGLGSYMSYMNGGDPAASARDIVAKAQQGGQGSSAGYGVESPNPARNIMDSLGKTVNATVGQARQSVARATAVVSNNEQGAEGNAAGKTVYRWVDNAGGVQYGTHPTADAREIEAIGLRSGGSDTPTPAAAAAKPAAEGYPLGRSHTELLRHLSVPD